MEGKKQMTGRVESMDNVLLGKGAAQAVDSLNRSGAFSITVSSASIRGAAFSLKEGDKIVIGTAMYGEYALIVVLSREIM
jgi:hypothetical protein